MVLVDGTRGTVTVSPDAGRGRARPWRPPSARPSWRPAWTGPGATADGHAVAILANVQDGAAARTARETPAEGVGLFRTELCFLNRDTEPTVDEQAADLRRGAGGVRRPQGRHQDAGRRLGQAAEVRRPPRGGQPGARCARHPDRRGQPGPAGAPAGRDRRRGRAHRQRAVGDGADDRHRRRSRNALPHRSVRADSPPA